MALLAINQPVVLIYQNREHDSSMLLQWIAAIELTLQQYEQKYSKPVNRIAFKTPDRFLSALFLYTAAVYGRTVLPLPNHLTEAQQADLCKTACIDLLISDDDVNDAAMSVINRSSFLEAVDALMEIQHYGSSASLDIHDDFQLIIATSGSTAKSKLVLLSRDNIAAHVDAINHRLHLSSDDRWLNYLPFSSVAGVMILFRCLFTDACHIVADDFNEETIWRAINQHAVSHISVVPIMLNRLLDVADQQLIPPSFKVMLVGGDRVSNRLFTKARQAHWPVLMSYGMSETSSTVALSDDNRSYQLLEGFQLAINDQGAIKLKGPAVMTANYINVDSGEQVLDQQDWLTTRDLGELDVDGFMIHGRLDNSFTSGGQTLSLESVEQQLATCPFLNEFRLNTVKHDSWGDTLVAFINGDVAETEHWCRQNLPSLYRPRYFFSLNQLPMNDMGKISNEKIHHLVDKVRVLKNDSA